MPKKRVRSQSQKNKHALAGKLAYRKIKNATRVATFLIDAFNAHDGIINIEMLRSAGFIGNTTGEFSAWRKPLTTHDFIVFHPGLDKNFSKHRPGSALIPHLAIASSLQQNASAVEARFRSIEDRIDEQAEMIRIIIDDLNPPVTDEKIASYEKKMLKNRAKLRIA